jgi:hypothetical protein
LGDLQPALRVGPVRGDVEGMQRPSLGDQEAEMLS